METDILKSASPSSLKTNELHAEETRTTRESAKCDEGESCCKFNEFGEYEKPVESMESLAAVDQKTGEQLINRIQDDLAEYFEDMHFKPAWIGGVSLQDVLKQLLELQKLYERQLENLDQYYQRAIQVRDLEIERLHHEIQKVQV